VLRTLKRRSRFPAEGGIILLKNSEVGSVREKEFPCCYFWVSPDDKKFQDVLNVFERKNSVLLFLGLSVRYKFQVDVNVFERRIIMF